MIVPFGCVRDAENVRKYGLPKAEMDVFTETGAKFVCSVRLQRGARVTMDETSWTEEKIMKMAARPGECYTFLLSPPWFIALKEIKCGEEVKIITRKSYLPGVIVLPLSSIADPHAKDILDMSRELDTTLKGIKLLKACLHDKRNCDLVYVLGNTAALRKIKEVCSKERYRKTIAVIMPDGTRHFEYPRLAMVKPHPAELHRQPLFTPPPRTGVMAAPAKRLTLASLLGDVDFSKLLSYWSHRSVEEQLIFNLRMQNTKQQADADQFKAAKQLEIEDQSTVLIEAMKT